LSCRITTEVNSWLASAIKFIFRKLNSNLCEQVWRFAPPNPERAAIADFVIVHHEEHRFIKRQRDRANPDAMARRAPLKDRK